MNLDRFTHKAQDVLQKTAQAARAEGHPEVTPEHLGAALREFTRQVPEAKDWVVEGTAEPE